MPNLNESEKTLKLIEKVAPLLKNIDQRNPSYESVEKYLYFLSKLYKELEISCVSLECFSFTQESYKLWLKVLHDELNNDCSTPANYSYILPNEILNRALEPFYCKNTGMHVGTFSDRIKYAIQLRQHWRNMKLREEAVKERNRFAQRLHYEAEKGNELAIAVKEAYKEYEAIRMVKNAKIKELYESYTIARKNLKAEHDRQLKKLWVMDSNEKQKWTELKKLFESPLQKE